MNKQIRFDSGTAPTGIGARIVDFGTRREFNPEVQCHVMKLHDTRKPDNSKISDWADLFKSPELGTSLTMAPYEI
jgi:hypothetical protein